MVGATTNPQAYYLNYIKKQIVNYETFTSCPVYTYILNQFRAG
ncbi:hypothetical protein SAMN05428988_3569 [Chitinophaga sp. YR573]|nr:hypothetical protein SAMN05428988_3569 [Chitinophaga sp. YR573]